MTFKHTPKNKKYIIQCKWGRLFMQYLNIDSREYGPAISYEELMKQTSGNQMELLK